MQYDEIVAMVKEVSKLGVSSFQFSEGDMHISMDFPVEKQEPAEGIVSRTVSPSVKQEETAASEQVVEGTEVKSPLVGTFYAAPEENGEPYVKVGDQVKKGQTLCIVEAMKLMNEIESETDGVVAEIRVKDKQTVEYGQTLFVIR